jgi:hypothetical protein
MRDFGPVVLSQALLVARRQAQLGKGRPVRSGLVRYHDGGRDALLLQQLSHQLQGGGLVAPALHECQCRSNYPHLCRSKIPQAVVCVDQPAG